MHSLIRFTLLGAGAAAGVGLAISLASQTTAPPGKKITRSQRYFSAPETPETPAAAALPPVPPPTLAQHQPPVAQDATKVPDLSEIRAIAERYQNAAERTNKTVEDLLNQNRQILGNPPATVAQPAPQPMPPLVPPMTEPLPAPEAKTPAFREPKSESRAVVQRGEGEDKLQINFQEADLRYALELIGSESGLNILPGKNVTGKVTATLVNVDGPTALTALLKSTGFIARREGNYIFVGTPADLDEMDRTQDQIKTRVYRPNYVRSADLQQLITPMLSQGTGKISVSSASEMDLPADTVKTGGNGFAGTDVVIVRDYEHVLRQVDQLVCEIDLQPQQVSIEAMILSVKLNDEYEFGVDFQLFRDQNHVRLVSGSPLANLAQFNLNGDGLRFGFLDASTALFINALETVGETNVVAAPRLLCLNKQRAEILIGAQKGYVSTTVTENASTQSIEFLEVGTQLRIRPYIFSDGTMRLEVHPELSTGDVKVQDGFTLPDKEVTQVTTNILCRDGSTVIIGGLIREDLAHNATQIPFLGSLPYVGAAFRQKTETISRNEVIVLITPRLVSEPMLSGEGRQAQKEFAVRQTNYADKMSPIAKRHYGRHYLRLAASAWNAGDQVAALRYANLAVHFDPQNLEANNLRQQAADTMPERDNVLHQHLKEGLRPWQHPLVDYSRQGSPWSNVNSPLEPPEPQPYDPGVPGRSIDLNPGPPPLRKLTP